MAYRMILAAVVLWIGHGMSAEAADPKAVFAVEETPGWFSFDTGVLRGVLRLDGKSQGISELIHVPSGQEVTYGGGHVGLVSPYRVFSTNTRYGHAARDWPSEPRLLSDGSIEAVFPPGDDHPLTMVVRFCWASPDSLDVETIAAPAVDMPRFEVFWSNYFAEGFDAAIYLRPPRKTKDAASEFVRPVFSPLVDGNYLMFPRDREAAEIVFDRRWEIPPNPVQWCVSRYLAAPLALRRNEAAGVTALLMAPPADCFAVATPYEKTPPDGIANHRSLYLSLFGRDVAKGQTVKARLRLVVAAGLADKTAVELYQKYLTELSE